MKLAILVAALALAAILPTSAGTSTERTIDAPGWIAYAMDLQQGDDVRVSFGIRSSSPIDGAAALMYILPSVGYPKHLVGIAGQVEGQADAIEVTTLGQTGPTVEILGGPAEPNNRPTEVRINVNFLNASTDRWYFVVLGGADSEETPSLFVRMDAPVEPWVLIGSSAFYADEPEDYGALAGATVTAQAQHAHASAAGSLSFDVRDSAFYYIENCVCRLNGPPDDSGSTLGWSVNGFRSWAGPPGMRTLEYAGHEHVGIDPTRVPRYGAFPSGLILLAGDVKLPS